MQVPTGGTAHEPRGRFGETPKPTVTVWMEENDVCLLCPDVFLYVRAFFCREFSVSQRYSAEDSMEVRKQYAKTENFLNEKRRQILWKQKKHYFQRGNW